MRIWVGGLLVVLAFLPAARPFSPATPLTQPSNFAALGGSLPLYSPHSSRRWRSGHHSISSLTTKAQADPSETSEPAAKRPAFPPALARASVGLALALSLGPLGNAPQALAAEPILLQPLQPAPPVKLPPPKDPYEAFEPAGKSFLGNKGPNLQLPEELSEGDEVPQRKLEKMVKGVKKEISLMDLNLADLGASLFWGIFLYFGIFDINLKTNVLSQARGMEGDERPSDWVKVRLGEALGIGQETWQDDWTAPLPLQAFTISLFALLGFASERGIAIALGSNDGFFALSGGVTSCIWAGVYELGRTQRVGYRASREEQEEMDAQWQAFLEFAEDRLEIKPTGRVYIKDVTKAFRQTYGKYRNEEQLAEKQLQSYFRTFARRNTGMRGKAGFYKGVALRDKASAFGAVPYSMQRNKEAEAARVEAKQEAQQAAEEAVKLAAERTRESDSESDSAPVQKRSEEV